MNNFLLRFIAIMALSNTFVVILWSIFMYWFFGTSFTENISEDFKNFAKTLVIPITSGALVATMVTDKKFITKKTKGKHYENP